MLLLAAAPALAAGFHFLRADGIYGLGDDGVHAAGAGVSLVSDALGAWATFGNPARDGKLVRAYRLELEPLGPVLGFVPPTFRSMVREPRDARALLWTPIALGGDAARREHVGLDAAAHWLVNVPGFLGVDPRHAYAGPSVGLGGNLTWWDRWRDHEVPVTTGAVEAQAALGGGLTLRDTWYTQARALTRVDLFGVHAASVSGAAATGLFLDRVGAPVGVEVEADVVHGDDNVLGVPDTTWALRASVFWKLVPPYQTRIEEDVERTLREREAQ